MEPRRVNETESESKCLSASCEQSSGHAAVTPPPDLTNDAPHEPPPSGKLRRTALRLFGGRKGICVLPSFFGGRNKNQNKWSSKKGVRKSRTHDGLSKANWEDGVGSGFAPAGDFEYHIEKDTAANSGCSEFGHPVGDQKSMSLPRQKKGLRGLFNSIRRHKKNRNGELEKHETVPMYFVCSKEVPVAQVNCDQNNTECLGKLTEPYVPDLNANTGEGEPAVSECIDVGVMVSEKNTKEDILNVGSENQLEEEVAVKNNDSPGSDMKLISNTFDSLPNNDPESATNSQLSVGSSDQISLIFGDVASLKSFDSLTGCGDIIADQDDDSIAESTVSGERSRNGGKRSSCYVTYQGGGEDMATPDEVDLQDLWENEAAEEVSFNHNQNESLVEHSDSLRLTPEDPSSCLYTDISSSGTLGLTDNTVTSGDVLTPQSDHQESVPNSDEGYYDSTTPGPDEEGHEKADRMRRDRLPRDSYSGDALYELFGPDDSLISPAFDNQLKLTGPVIHGYLDKSADVKEHQPFGSEMGSLEFENTSLTRILQDLHSAKLPSDSSKRSKELALFTKGLHNQGLNKSMTSKAQASVDPVTSEAFNQGNISQHGNKFSNLKSQPHEQSSEKNKIMAPQLKNNKNTSKQKTAEMEDDLAVSFSQALVDFTKNARLFGGPTEGMSGSESTSPFAQNLQALPAMVTFDVVDMDNEGEYDQQVDMTIEEDITSPYEVFEESYLQKDAFAECDDRMFDLYEQSLLSNTWAITSLPRHLSLTPANQTTPSRLALNRRSRSLDTDCLELEMTNIYLGSGAAPPSCHVTERTSKRVSSLHRKKNGHTPSAERKDGSSFMFLSWQQEAERSSVSTLTDGRRAENCPSRRLTPARHAPSSSQPGGQTARKPQQQSVSIIAERMSCSFNSQNTGLVNRPCHLPLKSEASGVQAPCVFSAVNRENMYVRSDLASDGGGEELFYTSSLNSQSSGQLCKMRAGGVAHGMPVSDSLDLGDGDRSFCSRARPAVDTGFHPACNKHTAGAKQPDLPTPLHNT
ncbi:APC membrane recruitment protein 1 [Osmerus mordax]|uniref:APC membrane recruitment protein 1 n=1 Tax=Osmerus mordax TaxID=8014 RepID=UPI00350F7B01